MRLLICSMFLLAGTIQNSFAQILFAESFNVLLDSNQTLVGSITPEVKIQTQKER